MKKDFKYAICEDCKQEMAPGNGCTASHVRIDGKIYKRIKAGDELDYLPDMEVGEICHDCNVKAGQYHHVECDMERCPACHTQLFCCHCNIE